MSDSVQSPDAWFGALQHPLHALFVHVREVVLRADARMSEEVKYGTVHFACGSAGLKKINLKPGRWYQGDSAAEQKLWF